MDLWVFNWEGRLFWDFLLNMSYSAELTNMKVSKGEELWEVSEKKIN